MGTQAVVRQARTAMEPACSLENELTAHASPTRPVRCPASCIFLIPGHITLFMT